MHALYGTFLATRSPGLIITECFKYYLFLQILFAEKWGTDVCRLKLLQKQDCHNYIPSKTY